MSATKLACLLACACIAVIAIAFLRILGTPGTQHPGSVLALGLASIGTFVALVVFTGAQILRHRSF